MLIDIHAHACRRRAATWPGEKRFIEPHELVGMLDAGCRGVGEYIANLPFDDPFNMNVTDQNRSGYPKGTVRPGRLVQLIYPQAYEKITWKNANKLLGLEVAAE